MTEADTARVFIAVGAAITWAGVRMLRRPDPVARGVIEWSSRRWLREEDVPAWVRDREHTAWSVRRLGRWVAVFGVLVLVLGVRMIFAAP